MNIADKQTLDLIKDKLDMLGTYVGYKNTPNSYQYYLPSGVKVVCDKTKVSVIQGSGSPNVIEDGYEITETGYVAVIASEGDADHMLFSLI